MNLNIEYRYNIDVCIFTEYDISYYIYLIPLSDHIFVSTSIISILILLYMKQKKPVK